MLTIKFGLIISLLHVLLDSFFSIFSKSSTHVRFVSRNDSILLVVFLLLFPDSFGFKKLFLWFLSRIDVFHPLLQNRFPWFSLLPSDSQKPFQLLSIKSRPITSLLLPFHSSPFSIFSISIVLVRFVSRNDYVLILVFLVLFPDTFDLIRLFLSYHSRIDVFYSLLQNRFPWFSFLPPFSQKSFPPPSYHQIYFNHLPSSFFSILAPFFQFSPNPLFIFDSFLKPTPFQYLYFWYCLLMV